MNTATLGPVESPSKAILKILLHTEYYDYAFEWTPNYVAWFINGEKYYRQDLPKHNYIATLKYVKNYDEPLGSGVRRLGGKVERVIRFHMRSCCLLRVFTGNYGTNNTFR